MGRVNIDPDIKVPSTGAHCIALDAARLSHPDISLAAVSQPAGLQDRAEILVGVTDAAKILCPEFIISRASDWIKRLLEFVPGLQAKVFRHREQLVLDIFPGHIFQIVHGFPVM